MRKLLFALLMFLLTTGLWAQTTPPATMQATPPGNPPAGTAVKKGIEKGPGKKNDRQELQRSLHARIALKTAAKSSSPNPISLARLKSSLAVAAEKSGCCISSPRATASRISFCMCLRGKAVAKLP